MTDEQIIKAFIGCAECPLYRKVEDCIETLCGEALDLVNRQKVEIERLTINMNAARLGMIAEHERSKTAKTEAVKEFAERLKEDISWHRTEMFMNGLKGTPRTHEITYECVEEYIDNLVKEMVGEPNETE